MGQLSTYPDITIIKI